MQEFWLLIFLNNFIIIKHMQVGTSQMAQLIKVVSVKTHNLNLIRGAHSKVERERWLHKFALWPSQVDYDVGTNNKYTNRKQNKQIYKYLLRQQICNDQDSECPEVWEEMPMSWGTVSIQSITAGWVAGFWEKPGLGRCGCHVHSDLVFSSVSQQ